MRERSVLGVDILMVVATVALVTIGVLFIYSSGVTSTGDSFSREWIRQLVWASVGIVLLIGLTILDYSRVRDWTPYIYGAVMLSLVGTLMFGRVVNGARSWIGIGEFGVQPSEFAKVAMILMLANFLDQRRATIRKPSSFLIALVIAGLPMGLVLFQPDLGTAVVYLPVFLVMAFVAGARPSYILFILATGVFLVVFTVLPAWGQFIRGDQTGFVSVLLDSRLFAFVLGAIVLVGIIGLVGVFALKRRYFGWVTYAASIVTTALVGSLAARKVLKDYQLMRLIVFLDPNIDPRGAGWNIIQSVTAVGSGGITGKGWLAGTQSHLQYLPQQSTDFIFSILAEEWGFLGVALIFTAYAIILVRGLVICAKAKDNFAVYAGTGIVTMIFFHVAVNVGMAIGIMPVTGIPLLFLSYGGSSLWTSLISVGLLMSIFQHRYRY
jgi:rod shape determining protein RodA